MSKAIILEALGGPEVLKLIEVNVPKPSAEEVTIRHTAIEVNYIDVYHRTGLYSLSNNPKIPGVSAVGTIEAVGDNVKSYKVGDRIGYSTVIGGAYSELRNVDQEKIYALPPELDDYTLASCMTKALTAHYLATRTFIVREGIGVLIHAAAGGVGRLLGQWCNAAGAYVIGTVGSNEKKAIALQNGCHEVFNYREEDWVQKVKEVTKGLGVNVVYDSVGQATYKQSIECLMKIGILVLYGSSSGAVESIDTTLLASKSIFITKPSLFDYKSMKLELLLSCNEVFERLKEGLLKVPKPKIFKLADAAQAHIALENRQNTEPLILVP